MKYIIIYLFCVFALFANDKYIPKNIEEKEILEKYRDKNLKVGFLDNFFFEVKSKDNKSSNDLLNEMLSEYLGLNIDIVKGDWPTLYGEFLNKEIDVLARISRHSNHKGDFIFSIPVADGKLHLVTNRDIDFPDYFKDISGEKVYLQNDSMYNEHFINYLLENDQTPEIEYVNNKFAHKNELILVGTYKLPYFKYSYEISDAPPTAFGLQKEYEDLVPIINNALKEKYIQEFTNINNYKNKDNYLNKFLDSLTKEEIEYINNLDGINIISEELIIKSYLMEESNIYLNETLILFDLLSKKIDLKFNEIDNNYNSWNDVYMDFINGNIDMLPMAKTKERVKDFYFTKAINVVSLYKITNPKSTSDKIGVMKGTIESSYVSNFYLKDEVRFFNTKEEMEQSIKSGDIKCGYLYVHDDFDLKKYDIEEVKNYPIYIALKKENKILGSIIDKAISNISNLSELKNKATKLGRERDFIKYQKSESTAKNLSIVLGLLITLLLLIIHKVIMNNTLIKKMKRDSLTGLPNREAFKILKKQKLGVTGYAILIDIDNFKFINEKYGFKAGDEILIAIAKILKEIFVNCKDIYRVSSNEFYVYFQDDDIDFCLLKLKKRVDSINEKKGDLLELSLSIGYFYRGNTQITIDEAFNFADMAMYEAKEIEGTCYTQANDELINRRNRERSIKAHLRSKDLQGIYPVFQPKFSIETKEIVGAEALARWKNEALGFVSPGEFIPIAEKIKLIYLIDYKIAEESVKSIRKWLDMGVIKDGFKLSFNISMETFNRDDIVKQLSNLLEKYRVSGKFLEIEVTESIFSSDLNKVLKKIEELKEKGYEISIDDFTAGHSAATLLSCIPASVIKFDKSILDTIKEGEVQSETIYKNLIALAKDLKMKIVAEGVETKYQFNFLKENKVDIAQGFLLSRPLEEKDFLEKL